MQTLTMHAQNTVKAYAFMHGIILAMCMQLYWRMGDLWMRMDFLKQNAFGVQHSPFVTAKPERNRGIPTKEITCHKQNHNTFSANETAHTLLPFAHG